ncbi:MAG: uroporphyrin-III C-methyltransferase [Lacrimispora sp.]|nr:uroporphyrin-III C-methyltransferase [Lacrimispora sp.]
MKKTGVVYLVGAGPGDPGLITQKGLKRLGCCDALVYDSLASDYFLDEVPDHCKKIYVGKRAGAHSMKQEEINRLLVELAEEGLNVVRLKGGDPFVFGRGGEEILALLEAGIPYEVVPGVTSAVAALSMAGIPVTHRAVSRSFHVMTGHTLSENGTLPPDFDSFAKLSGTLIFLMGLSNLSLIVKGLVKNGKPEDTPAAVIENGTLPEQRTVRGTLKDIESRAQQAEIKSPAIIVAGDVAALDFSSTLNLPLKGCRIGITGTESFAGRLSHELLNLGGILDNVLTLSIASYRSGEAMKEAYQRLKTYSWLVLTSANAVRDFFAGLFEGGYDLRSLGAIRFAAVGKGTEAELLKFGFHADYVPDRYQVKDLAEGLISQLTKEDRLLIPRSSGGSPELNQILEEAGVFYKDIVLYDVALKQSEQESMENELAPLHYLTFASASGVDAFFQGEREKILSSLASLKVVCIGDITAKALSRYGREADLIAPVYSVSGLAEIICQDWCKEKE